jgi:hypothetical protein
MEPSRSAEDGTGSDTMDNTLSSQYLFQADRRACLVSRSRRAAAPGRRPYYSREIRDVVSGAEVPKNLAQTVTYRTVSRVTSLEGAGMKRFSVLLGAAAFALAGCQFFNPVQGSGNLVTTAFDLGAFTKVEASQACTVHVVPGQIGPIEVTCDDNIVDYLVVERTGADSIAIGLKPGYWYRWVTFAAEVRMPVLEALDLSGASTADVEPGFSSTNPLYVALSGASNADVASIACGALRADLSGASVLTLAGTADSERLDVSGASKVHVLDCAAASAVVDLSGASEGWLDVGAGSLSLEASGASTLFYRDAPSWGALKLSGGSRIVKLD